MSGFVLIVAIIIAYLASMALLYLVPVAAIAGEIAEKVVIFLAIACVFVTACLFWHAWYVWPGASLLEGSIVLALVVLALWYFIILDERILPHKARVGFEHR